MFTWQLLTRFAARLACAILHKKDAHKPAKKLRTRSNKVTPKRNKAKKKVKVKK